MDEVESQSSGGEGAPRGNAGVSEGHEGAPQEKEQGGGPPAAIIVDLGRKSKRSVDRLRKGCGPLVDEVDDCLDGLRDAGALSDPVQPVIVVVSERLSPPRLVPVILPPGLPAVLPLGLEEDEDGEDDDDDNDDDNDDD